MAESNEALSKLSELTLAVAPNAADVSEQLQAIETSFELVQTHYSDRNQAIEVRRDYFAGAHWQESEEDIGEDEFRLVFNYCRRVVLDFAGMLARAPVPRVPIPPKKSDDPAVDKARKREKLLAMAWDDFLEAWRRAELNAAKCSYGVIEILWKPPEVETIETLEASPGGESPKVQRYRKCPFLFRSITPEDFFPVYRTKDRSDDYLYLYRFDPGRLIEDINQKYHVTLQSTGTDESGAEPACDLIEYWDDKNYALLARTLVETVPEGRDLTTRFRRLVGKKDQTYEFTVLEAFAHEYGREPFWVVQNIVNTDADPTDGGSISDIDDIADLNRHLNLMRSEQAEEIMTTIHRPLVYYSGDHMQDPKQISYTAGAVLPIGAPGEEELKPLDPPVESTATKEHIEAIESSIRTLSFLGDAGFGMFGAGTSGVAARIALTPLQRILELKLPPRTYVLQGVCAFLLRIFEQKAPNDVKLRGWVSTSGSRYELMDVGKADIAGQYYASLDYGNLLPRDDQAHSQNEVYLYKASAQSLSTTLDNMGFEDPHAEIEMIKAEAQDPWLNPERYMAVIQAMQMKQQMDAAQQAAPAAGAAPGAPAGPTVAGAPTAPGQPGPRAMGAPVPSSSTFPGQQGFGAGALTPFLQRMQGRGLPPAQPGPGIRQGGEG